MRLIPTLLLFASVSAPVMAVADERGVRERDPAASRIGVPVPWADGIIVRQSDDRTVWSDGRSARHSGATVIYNDGTTATRTGSLTIFGNGRGCMQMATATFCD